LKVDDGNFVPIFTLKKKKGPNKRSKRVKVGSEMDEGSVL
jgi:hypothetical protein